MARRKHTKVHAGFRSKNGSHRKLRVAISVERTAERNGAAFYSCVRVLGGKRFREGSGDRCAYGRNPRAALANAMTNYAKSLRKRAGAFRGL